MLSLVWAVIRQRCPECRKGPVFHGLMSMYQECRVCGLRFEREPGYFYGAMYLSYAFAFLSSAYWIILLVMGVNPWIVILLPTIQIILEIPLTFRYSRVAWLAVDHALDPGHDTKWLPEKPQEAQPSVAAGAGPTSDHTATGETDPHPPPRPSP